VKDRRMTETQDEADFTPILVPTVCGICGANVYTVNLDPHLDWHKRNDRG